ncbi:YokU family protein [Bacillus sp. MUM 13]|uniref:YokU family protein n=1 Tax=Bacillus sp. MUM 13 TaxID=1678001 RepID=UPI0008F5A9C2|nr:YokU family protein [Bacillus sp. MUM 13]OIK09494.1 hypothetical protein BIV59_16760 [Bacillus sp. MUM 13]
MELCPWCGDGVLTNHKESVYWELPDGTKAIEIKETPSKLCSDCKASFQTEDIVKTIEDQLFLINTSTLEKVISYGELLKKERLLKRNYFDFT